MGVVDADMRMRPLVAIAAACGAGALDPGCREGPAAFRRYWDSTAGARHAPLAWEWVSEDLPAAGATPRETVARTVRSLAQAARRLAEGGRRLLVIGGDHSCAVGTWRGLASAMHDRAPLGLIWIDAHLDMHVPATTHSGAINGMPLAALLGYGLPELTGTTFARPALLPRHVCVVGARSFEPEEIAFARTRNVRVIDMAEVKRRGIKDALAEARAIASAGTAGYGVSLDLDAFDPADAPAVGTPEPDGVRAREFFAEWVDLTRRAECRGVEIVEYNPSRDDNDRTVRLLCDLAAATIREARLQWTA